MYAGLRGVLPKSLARYVMFFEAEIESAVVEFAGALPPGIRVLDAGAGEGGFRRFFPAQRYLALDLGVGDATWDYSRLDVVGDLAKIPVRTNTFDAAINIVTLEHVPEPGIVLQEVARVLSPGGRLLLIAPHEWEEHQQPHDYYRYTRFGLRYLLEQAGFADVDIRPVGGYFRLMSRRLLNGLQFFPGPFMLIAAIFLAPLALVLPLFDSLDKQRSFTLGYICTARKPV